MKNRSRHSGFTLLEVVVAVAILGVSVGAAVQIFSSGLKNIRRIELAHRAMNHAENVMNEILADSALTGPTELSGDLDEEFRYEASVDYWEAPDDSRLQLDIVEDQVELLSIVVVIHFKNDPGGKTYEATSLKAISLQPQSAPGPPLNPLQQIFGGGN